MSPWVNLPPRVGSSKTGTGMEGIRAYWQRIARALSERGFLIEQTSTVEFLDGDRPWFLIEFGTAGASASIHLEFDTRTPLGQNSPVDITTYCSLDARRPSTTRRYMKWDPAVWETVDWFDRAVSRVSEYTPKTA